MALLAVVACGGQDRVIVGAGTSIVDSGFIGEVAGDFSGDVSIVGGATAELLELAAQGSVSVAIVHDEVQELAFMAAHPDAERRPVFASKFLIVGPPDLVASSSGQSAVDVFAEIAANDWTFVTRDDKSGTHVRELAIWGQAGMSPAAESYVATGQGMGFTLQVADQRDGFTLVEAGAYLAAADTLSLEPVLLAPSDDLLNRYSAILVDEDGREFFDWLTSPEGVAAVVAANEELFGEVVYAPSE
jgi:tungstate transport system substrate-binding protein